MTRKRHFRASLIFAPLRASLACDSLPKERLPVLHLPWWPGDGANFTGKDFICSELSNADSLSAGARVETRP